MSKSKCNVVDPGKIISGYGADTARLFMLSDSPPERDLEWTDSGIEGAWRYVNRLWRIAEEASEACAGTSPNEKAEKTRRQLHRTIAQVSEAYERFHFNGAVAKIRELSNALEELDAKNPQESGVLRESVETLTQLIAPMLPHVAEEMWETLGHKTMLIDTPWPKADPALLIENTVTIAVQVNGKLRATLTLPRDMPVKEVEATALSDENVKRALDNKPPKKVIVVPNKIVNVVV